MESATAAVRDDARDAGPRPRVSVGLPVHNGEKYLRAAIDSILAQDFEDLELLIGDNGSTDGTAAICREAAQRDPRVLVHRSDVNRGAAWNFNRLVDLARGEYFKWAAHDDVLAPAFVRRCVEALDERPDVSLAYAGTARIDHRGEIVGTYESHGLAAGCRPAQRAASLILSPHECVEVFGVMRRSQLLRTGRIGPYTASDRTLLLELALRGPFHEVPGTLFLHREHPERSIRKLPDWKSRTAWFDTSRNARFSFPVVRLFREYLLAAARSPVAPTERLLAVITVLRWSALLVRRWAVPRGRRLRANLGVRSRGGGPGRGRGGTTAS